MAETVNISRMAELLSDKLFKEFHWARMGPTNANWACIDKERHKGKGGTHPTDAVFWYNEPYADLRTYVACDLKSYAAGSISSSSVSAAIESLAKSLHCAERSEQWQKLFVHDRQDAAICALLFIYNHDGDYDKDFQTLLLGVNHSKLDIPRGTKLVVLGPKDIFWLDNVRYEIVHQRGQGKLPDREHCGFFHPPQVLHKKVQFEHARAATLESLTAPWLILRYTDPKRGNQKGYVVFYRRTGETVDEFLYLIDYLVANRVVDDDTEVQIKSLFGVSDSAATYAKAVDRYIEECEGGADMSKLLKRIVYSQFSAVKSQFSEIEIGMRNVE